MTLFIDVKYTEFEPETYSGCSLYFYGTEYELTVFTDDFEYDLLAISYVAYIISKLTGLTVCNKSSVNHFFQDREDNFYKGK